MIRPRSVAWRTQAARKSESPFFASLSEVSPACVSSPRRDEAQDWFARYPGSGYRQRLRFSNLRLPFKQTSPNLADVRRPHFERVGRRAKALSASRATLAPWHNSGLRCGRLASQRAGVFFSYLAFAAMM